MSRLDRSDAVMRREAGGLAAMVASALVLGASAARATDGGYAAPDPPPAQAAAEHAAEPTYYESVLGSRTVGDLASPEAQAPTGLQVVEASATAQYTALAAPGERRAWQVRLVGFSRRHERVDATYDMLLLLPLPATADGRDAFQAIGRGVAVEEGAPERAVPFIYGGEKVVLKRNVGLEKTFVHGLLAGSSGAAGLPDLAGTGYHWTAWDAIFPRDASYGDGVRASATLRFRAPAAVAAPDPSDPRFAAYVVTWIPALPATVPPYAVRIDVIPAAP
jgi:hypothetical protein